MPVEGPHQVREAAHAVARTVGPNPRAQHVVQGGRVARCRGWRENVGLVGSSSWVRLPCTYRIECRRDLSPSRSASRDVGKSVPLVCGGHRRQLCGPVHLLQRVGPPSRSNAVLSARAPAPQQAKRRRRRRAGDHDRLTAVAGAGGRHRRSWRAVERGARMDHGRSSMKTTQVGRGGVRIARLRSYGGRVTGSARPQQRGCVAYRDPDGDPPHPDGDPPGSW